MEYTNRKIVSEEIIEVLENEILTLKWEWKWNIKFYWIKNLNEKIIQIIKKNKKLWYMNKNKIFNRYILFKFLFVLQ